MLKAPKKFLQGTDLWCNPPPFRGGTVTSWLPPPPPRRGLTKGGRLQGGQGGMFATHGAFHRILQNNWSVFFHMCFTPQISLRMIETIPFRHAPRHVCS